MRRWLPGLATLAAALVLAACSSDSSPTGPTPGSITYVALGASDAVGIGAVPLSNGYVFDLRDRMDAMGFRVSFRNLGRSGAKADEIVLAALPEAVAASPDIVTLWTGPNDLVGGRSPEVFAAQLDGILAELRARTGALVFVGDLPDLTRAPMFLAAPDPDVTRERIEQFNLRIHVAVSTHGAILVSLSDLSTDRSMFFIDGFHPSNTGHRALADRFWARIAPRL